MVCISELVKKNILEKIKDSAIRGQILKSLLEIQPNKIQNGSKEWLLIVLNIEQWALNYRQGAYFNTNIYLEIFHRLIKHCYFKGKSNKCLDKLLYVLLTIVKNEVIKQIIKLEKGQSMRCLDLGDKLPS